MPTYSCISLWQPWASLLAHGEKRIETRSWAPPNGRAGVVLIHAAQRKPPRCERGEYFYRPGHFRRCLTGCGIRWMEEMPLGKIVGVGRLVYAMRTEDVRDQLSEQELAFGNYVDGRWAWRFSGLRPLQEPIPYRGRQGFFNVDREGLTDEAIRLIVNL